MNYVDFLKSTSNIVKRGNETYFNMCSILAKIEGKKNIKLKIEDSVLMTPFYIESGVYELYPYDLNIYLFSGSLDRLGLSEEERIGKLIRNFVVDINDDDPFVDSDLIKIYINYLLNNNNIKEEIECVFCSEFDSKNLYFAVY